MTTLSKTSQNLIRLTLNTQLKNQNHIKTQTTTKPFWTVSGNRRTPLSQSGNSLQTPKDLLAARARSPFRSAGRWRESQLVSLLVRGKTIFQITSRQNDTVWIIERFINFMLHFTVMLFEIYTCVRENYLINRNDGSETVSKTPCECDVAVKKLW